MSSSNDNSSEFIVTRLPPKVGEIFDKVGGNEVASWLTGKPVPMHTQDFHNWSGNITCTVDAIFEPSTKQELKWIVVEARKRGKKVRAVGDGHSWSPLWFKGRAKDGWIVKSVNLNSWKFDKENELLAVGPGLTLGDLTKAELQIGYCIPTQVVMKEVYIGGVVGTGSHGTGWERPTIADFVHEVTLITWDGSERVITEKDGDLFHAVQAGLGCFGLIWEIKFKVVPMPIVQVIDYKPVIEDVFDRKNPKKLKDFVLGHDYVEVFWFPLNHGRKLWIKTFRYAPPGTQPKDGKCERVADIEGLFAAETSRWFDWIDNKVPLLTDEVSTTLLALLDENDKNPVPTYQTLSYAMHFQPELEKFAPMLDTEMCLRVNDDFSNIVEAFLGVVEKTEQWAAEGKYPLNVCFEARFIANSEVLLSPAYGPKGTHHCYIECISWQKTPGFEEFVCENFIPWMRDHQWNAIPHMGKYWQILNDPKSNFFIEPYLKKAFGDRFQRFAKVRDEIDPPRLFLNQFLEDWFYKSTPLPVFTKEAQIEAMERELAELEHKAQQLRSKIAYARSHS